MKKGLVFSVLLLVAITSILLISLAAVSAQQNYVSNDPTIAGSNELPGPNASASSTTSNQSLGCDKIPNQFLREQCKVWLTGFESDKADINQMGQIIKWIFLFLIVIMIYSALEFGKFPDQMWLRWVVAILVGFLATFFITTRELLTAMQGYTALGITLAVFFPILILGFFTLVVATRANPIGILLQKIMWIIFSGWLLIKTWILWALLNPAEGEIVAVGQNVSVLWNFTKIEVTQGLLTMAQNSDKSMLLTLMVVSIACIIVMVLSNKPLIRWIGHEMTEAKKESYNAELERSRAVTQANAKQLEKS
jgi:hypothetical protein